ncbi:MAG: hypothetical protein ABI901_14585, partial [Roseiflexaceae bacterium]
MATDPETKLPLNRRDALRAIAFGAAGVTLAACGGATTPAAAPTAAAAAAAAATAAPAAEAATAMPAAGAPTAMAEAATAGPADAAPTAAGAAKPTPTVGINTIGSGAKTVVFWHGLGGADGATMQEMLKTYAAEKGDRTVRSETYDWNVFYQKFPTSVVAKTPPNLAIMHSWALEQFANQGLLQ